MSRKWFHKLRFDKPSGSSLVKVWRIIMSDKDGIDSVQWLHAYKTKLGTFICVERSISLPVTYRDPVAEDMKQYYSKWELFRITHQYRGLSMMDINKEIEVHA